MKIVVLHKVVNCAYRTVGTVFYRENPVSAQTLFNSVENTLKAVEIHNARNLKQLFACCLRVCAGNTLTCHYCFVREKLRCVFQSLSYFQSQI